MHGPCSGTPGNQKWCPSFASPIPLLDDVLKTISPLRVRKRRRWRRARDAALALWGQAGVRFTVEEGPGARYSYFDPEHPLDTYLTPFIIQGKVRLVRDVTPPGGRDDMALFFGGGSVATFDLEKPVTDPIYEWPRVVCHEVGHCLGLMHGTTGKPPGVMLGGLVPNSHDLDSIRGYYKL